MSLGRDLLKTREAAEFLSVHVETLRRLARSGRIPSIKLGKDWRFSRNALYRFSETGDGDSRSDRIFRDMAENSRDVIMHFDHDLRHLYVNQAIEGLTNLRVEDFIGRKHAELGFPTHLVELWETALRKTLDEGCTHNIEFQLPGGTWIDWLLIPEFDKRGNICGAVTAARDITRLKGAESGLKDAMGRLEERVAERTRELSAAKAALEKEVEERRKIAHSLLESQERLREREVLISSVADYLPGGLIYQIVRQADGTRRFTFISGAVEALHGCTAAEALAESGRIYSTVMEEDRERVTREEEAAFERMSIFQSEMRIHRPDGSIGWSYFASRPRWLENGATCWDGLEIDITARRKMEIELRSSEARYRHASLHDSLTGLLNRAAFEEKLSALDADPNSLPVSVLVLDVNRLKLVNDSMGHAVGDRLLISTAESIAATLPGSATLFRIGGDEFCVLAERMPLREATQLKANILRTAKAFDESETTFELSFSIGVAGSESLPGKSIMAIFQAADDDMYRVKLANNESSLSHIETLVAALDAHDFGSQGHLDRVAVIVEAMAARLELSENRTRDLIKLARLHDLGKVGIHAKILQKKSALTEQEWTVVRTHSEIGYRIASRSKDLDGIARLILLHHERWDGSGYPIGLKGENIPLECRILSIADAFDAMVSERPYRRPFTEDEAIRELTAQSGRHFDPEVLVVFIDMHRQGLFLGLRTTSGFSAKIVKIAAVSD